jgi:hypothetical protein
MTAGRWLILLVAAHALFGLLYIRTTPIFEASDEGAHYGVIQWLVRGNGLPVQNLAQPKQPTIYHQEGSQPPLYYFLSAALTFWMPTADYEFVSQPNPRSQVGYVGANHNVNLYRPQPPSASGETARAVTVIRLFSLVLSCLTLWLTFQLAHQVFHNSISALLAVALVAFNPMVLFINSAINNDNLVMVLSTATLLSVVNIAHSAKPLSKWKLIELGFLLGLAALTKISGLVLWPLVALGLFYCELRRRKITLSFQNWPAVSALVFPLAASLLVVYGVALVVCGWWYIRNIFLYGEILGLNTMVAVAGSRSVSLLDLLPEWYGFYMSFWGIFGAFTIIVAPWVQWFFHAFTGLALASLALALWRSRAKFSFIHFLLITFVALTLIGVIRWTLQTPASQGRLLFGAIAPISMGLAAGWLALLGKRFARAGAVVLSVVLAVIAFIVPIIDIAPKYAPPPVLREAQLPADLKPVQARLSDGVELLGYTSSDALVKPGENARVTLYWRAVNQMQTDDTLALVVNGQGANVVSKIDSWPGRGLWPTSFWTPGEIYADTYEFPVAADALTPTILRLRLWLWRAGPDDGLPVRTPDGTETDAVTLTIGRMAADSTPSAPPVADGSTFEYGLTLVGYDNLSSTGQINFYWQARERVPENYTLFVHLVDEQGNKLAQADGEPLKGDWPTSAWEPRQTFIEPRQLNVPADLQSGRHFIQLGWYDAVTGVRLTAFQPNGEVWPDNAVTFEITK